MAYNAQAESFSAAARTPYCSSPGQTRGGFSYPAGWSLFNQVYSDIADATPTEDCFRASALVGQLPSIARFAPKTQHDIIAVVIRDMQKLPADADRLERALNGVYRWVFAARGAA